MAISATNAALQLAKAAKRKPRELAQAIVAALPASDIVSRVEIAGPGFINFYLAPAAYHAELLRIADAGAAYGRSQLGGGRRVDSRVRVRQSDRTAARRSRPACGVRGDRRKPARCDRARGAPRVLHQRSRPADGDPRGERLAALSRALRRALRLPEQRLSRRLPAADRGRAAQGPRAVAQAARRRCLPLAAARRAGRRQGRVHRRGHRPQQGDAGRRRLVGRL